MIDPWDDIRRHTRARIGLGRSGNGVPTRRHLQFVAAHAEARDAVHTALDVETLAERICDVGIGAPLIVRSAAADRATYLRRPDLGRIPESGTKLPPNASDIGIALCDGLSATALAAHGPGLTAAIVQARVALGDHIGAQLGVTTMLVLIGERPGLSVADSVGIYLTHHPRPGRTDAQRNCVSNVHPPDGMTYDHAARVVAVLVDGARRMGASGIALKDSSRDPGLTDTERPAL